ncbi:PTS glucitol/sorbitol transporter subunit IIA [Methylobacterium sp. ID0610]|uniref:PTS glucitol/sorbitol transporter subunit IIA n=1 Tax=Methylobacterium carpenticola TaxID=3344827 RepID=UPI00369CDB33
MTILLRSRITEVGPDAAEMISGGVLILFADGAPPELAEISVLHKVEDGPSEAAPAPGAELTIGAVGTVLTGVGSRAWAKIRDIGHVVVNFNGEDVPERPGDLCAAPVNTEALLAALNSGAEIRISA